MKNAERAYEIFGKPGEQKLEKWRHVSRCRSAPCMALGDAARVVECVYKGEVEVRDHVVVLCHAATGYGCGEYAMWDPCNASLRRLAE